MTPTGNTGNESPSEVARAEDISAADTAARLEQLDASEGISEAYTPSVGEQTAEGREIVGFDAEGKPIVHHEELGSTSSVPAGELQSMAKFCHICFIHFVDAVEHAAHMATHPGQADSVYELGAAAGDVLTQREAGQEDFQGKYLQNWAKGVDADPDVTQQGIEHGFDARNVDPAARKAAVEQSGA